MKRDNSIWPPAKRRARSHGGSFRENPTFLPADLVVDLAAILADGNIVGEDATRFLQSCNAHAQRVQAGRWDLAPFEQRQVFEGLQDACSNLMRALKALPDEAAADMDAHLFGKGFAFVDQLDHLYEHAGAMKDLAAKAAAAVPVSANRRVDAEIGEGLVDGLVWAYQCMFDALPPGAHDGWFVTLTTRLGTHLKLACGQRIVTRVLKRYKELRQRTS